jgi:hypothetical protein
VVAVLNNNNYGNALGLKKKYGGQNESQNHGLHLGMPEFANGNSNAQQPQYTHALKVGGFNRENGQGLGLGNKFSRGGSNGFGGGGFDFKTMLEELMRKKRQQQQPGMDSYSRYLGGGM